MVCTGIKVLVGVVLLEMYLKQFQTDFGLDALNMTVSEATFIMITP